MSKKNTDEWIDHLLERVEWPAPPEYMHQRILNALDDDSRPPSLRATSFSVRTCALIIAVLAGFLAGGATRNDSAAGRSFSGYTGAGMMLAENFKLGTGENDDR